ncbi:MAG: zf-TFIIB domain-containing protein [Candidatus Pacebacteria bacterium]|nr:zf-TFIIB domain-containing protein [Candidatus Paceibacterota bacterium]
MLCPICKKTLEKILLCNTEVDFCPDCLGLWFEKDELRQAKDNKDKNINWLDIDLWKDKEKLKIASGQKLCPNCRLPLYEVQYSDSGVKVDICNICEGIWLDRGEFKKIIDYLRKKADYEILNKYAKNLFLESTEVFSGPETLREEVDDFLTILKLLNYKLTVQHPHLAKLISSTPK